MRFKDDAILVVCSAAGIAYATVKQLLKEGAHVIAFDLREDALAQPIALPNKRAGFCVLLGNWDM